MSDLEKGLALSEAIHKLCVGHDTEIILRALTTNMGTCFEQMLKDKPDAYTTTVNNQLNDIARFALVLRGGRTTRDA